MDWILKYPEDETPKEFICKCQYTNSCLRITRNKQEKAPIADQAKQGLKKYNLIKLYPMRGN